MKNTKYETEYTKQETEYIDLVLINGESIQLEIPSDNFEEVYEDLKTSVEASKILWIDGGSGTTAMYKGFSLNNINCNLIIGW